MKALTKWHLALVLFFFFNLCCPIKEEQVVAGIYLQILTLLGLNEGLLTTHFVIFIRSIEAVRLAIAPVAPICTSMTISARELITINCNTHQIEYCITVTFGSIWLSDSRQHIFGFDSTVELFGELPFQAAYPVVIGTWWKERYQTGLIKLPTVFMTCSLYSPWGNEIVQLYFYATERKMVARIWLWIYQTLMNCFYFQTRPALLCDGYCNYCRI